MSILIRDIPTDDIMALAPQVSGLYIQTGSTDHNGRPVTGHIQDAKLMADGNHRHRAHPVHARRPRWHHPKIPERGGGMPPRTTRRTSHSNAGTGRRDGTSEGDPRNRTRDHPRQVPGRDKPRPNGRTGENTTVGSTR